MGEATVTRESAMKAGRELSDLAALAVDQTPNKEQLGEFVSESFQAVQAVAAIGIPKEHKAAVMTNIAEGFLNGLNTKVAEFQLPAA